MIPSVAAWLLMLPRSAEADCFVDGPKQIIEVGALDDRKRIPKPAAENVQILLRQETNGNYLRAFMHVFFLAINQNRTTPEKRRCANCFTDGFCFHDLPTVSA